MAAAKAQLKPPRGPSLAKSPKQEQQAALLPAGRRTPLGVSTRTAQVKDISGRSAAAEMPTPEKVTSICNVVDTQVGESAAGGLGQASSVTCRCAALMHACISNA